MKKTFCFHRSAEFLRMFWECGASNDECTAIGVVVHGGVFLVSPLNRTQCWCLDQTNPESKLRSKPKWSTHQQRKSKCKNNAILTLCFVFSTRQNESDLASKHVTAIVATWSSTKFVCVFPNFPLFPQSSSHHEQGVIMPGAAAPLVLNPVCACGEKNSDHYVLLAWHVHNHELSASKEGRNIIYAAFQENHVQCLFLS